MLACLFFDETERIVSLVKGVLELTGALSLPTHSETAINTISIVAVVCKSYVTRDRVVSLV